jgi:ribosomal protein L11 methyltransferase
MLEDVLVQQFPRGFEQRDEAGQVRFVTYTASVAELRKSAIDLRRAVKALGYAARAIQIVASSMRNDWQTRWIAELGPQQLTARTKVIPVDGSKVRRARPAGEVHLLQRAAFGFGEHATTRLMACEIERRLSATSKPSVLDVGTGTGVLAIVAAVSGASRVLGIDIDRPSITAAKANARLNGVSKRCSFGAQLLSDVAPAFDLVLANLDVPTLASLARDLKRVLAPKGVLLVSGVLEEAEAEVTAIFAKEKLSPCARAREGEWVMVGYRRR